MEKISREEWEAMKNVDVKTVDADTLVDIKDVTIDLNLSKEERLRQFIDQIKNPYCFKCGKMIVKLEFADTDKTMEDRMKEYLNSVMDQPFNL